MSTLAQRRTERRLRTALAGIAAFVAFWAYAGAIGLACGAIDLGADATARLPFGSPVFAATMLTLVVAIPMTATVPAAARPGPGVIAIGAGSGLLLVGWIAIQPFVVDRVIWLQPVFGVLGSVMCVLAYALWRHRH
ncbi:hypothetical protein [Nocardia arizonensis]|uniref:hypothetical protein n=1 Tax=Nocardia arizonensis TaxID=1141647 RepID=UPI0006D291B7|nr:hypothetical protein [Nocardia arizonensis]